jgi:hypothetical protein
LEGNLDALLVYVDIFQNPEKYSVSLPIKEIIADTKVDPGGVMRYKTWLSAGKQLRPIVVVKHPRENLYAVVDGHHRFFAQLEFGVTTINCAVIHDFMGFMFHLTKDGWLQPHPTFTKHVRAPILEFQQKLDQSLLGELRGNLKQFLVNFHRNPDELIATFRELMKKRLIMHSTNDA